MGTCARVYDGLTSSLMVSGNNSPSFGGTGSRHLLLRETLFISGFYLQLLLLLLLLLLPFDMATELRLSPSGHCADNASTTPDNGSLARPPPDRCRAVSASMSIGRARLIRASDSYLV